MYEQFLLTGGFGPIRLGSTRYLIENNLGPPEDRGYGKSQSIIFAYNSRHLQLAFMNDEVVHFGLYFKPTFEPISINNLTLSHKTAPAEICSWIRDAGISWTEIKISESTQLRFNNGVVAIFEDGCLDSLQVS